MTPEEQIADLARLVAHNGYALHVATLGHGAPYYRRLGERIRNPQVGDLVLETSTYYREPWDPGALGRLLRTDMEPVWPESVWLEENPERPYAECPTEKVWYVEPFLPTADGKMEVRWHNAGFIAVVDRLRWVPD